MSANSAHHAFIERVRLQPPAEGCAYLDTTESAVDWIDDHLQEGYGAGFAVARDLLGDAQQPAEILHARTALVHVLDAVGMLHGSARPARARRPLRLSGRRPDLNANNETVLFAATSGGDALLVSISWAALVSLEKTGGYAKADLVAMAEKHKSRIEQIAQRKYIALGADSMNVLPLADEDLR
jgi:hypothetical protein